MHIASSPCVCLQTPEGFSSPDGLKDRGHTAEGTLTEDPDLPVGPRQRAGAPETAGAQQEGANEMPAGGV